MQKCWIFIAKSWIFLQKKLDCTEWDYELNALEHLFPDDLTSQSGKVAHWICSKNPKHKWSAAITNRTTKGAGCPICSNNKLMIGENDLKSKYPEIAKEWNYEKNNKKPEEFAPSSTKIVWWTGQCGHSWEMPIASRTGEKQQGCPYCSSKRVLLGFNDFPTKNPKAFKEWDWGKNDMNPYSLTVSSSKKAFWICGKNPRHQWRVSISSRVRTNCPFCSGNKVLSGDNDLKTMFPQIAEEWDYERNEIKRPEDFTPHSSKKVWWKGKCGHSWFQKIGSRTGSGKQGCPYCAKKKTIVGENDLETLYPTLAKQWDMKKNGELKPSDVFPSSSKKVWWINEDGSSIKSAVRYKVRTFSLKVSAIPSSGLKKPSEKPSEEVMGTKI